MSRIIISPSKYVQGKGELSNLGLHQKNYGEKPLILISHSGKERFYEMVYNSLAQNKIIPVFECFNGECSKNEVNRLIEIYKDLKCDCVVGIGGGKILDTAKALSFYVNSTVSIIPTIASTDAPCSALTVLYTDEGVFDEYLFLPNNPNLVLVDTNIIVNAPTRLLVAGMGDALATFFEARACKASNSNTCAGGKITNSGYALAKLCYETLMKDGLNAKLAAEESACTFAVENIVEANTFLSGVGFESGGLAAAHSIHNGFTLIEESHSMYHGEKVAFGTIVQLVLENANELYEVIDFCKKVGLPTTLKELGVKEIDHKKLIDVSKAAVAENETIHNLPFAVNYEDVYHAILAADRIGREF